MNHYFQLHFFAALFRHRIFLSQVHLVLHRRQKKVPIKNRFRVTLYNRMLHKKYLLYLWYQIIPNLLIINLIQLIYLIFHMIHLIFFIIIILNENIINYELFYYYKSKFNSNNYNDLSKSVSSI